MKYIGPASNEQVQAAYMPVTEYVDESGFNPDDMRHPRWCHPVVPDPRAAGELERRLDALGIKWREFGGIDGARSSFDSDLIQVPISQDGIVYWQCVPRWPDKRGEYGGPTIAPQYCIRSDGTRRSLDALLEFVAKHQ